MKIEIDDEHIKEAEQIFIKGKRFDGERRMFISNLDTCDLLAVPGSGKTTALMAKLYCLSKQLPFSDSSGILVLAHTNAAVDEIENKLKKHCPNLFEYPNFVGTIQSFVNQFLAIPYYINTNNTKIYKIDSESYNKEIEFRLSLHKTGEIAYLKNKNSSLFFNARFRINENGEHYLTDGYTKNKLNINVPEKWIKENTAEAKKKIILDYIQNQKIEIIHKGILHFDDCYFLAEKYLYKYPTIKNQLQSRFKNVFIDEMQDLEKHQIDIIDDVFFKEDSKTIIQRIGDKNQAIYNSGKHVKTECNWDTREEIDPEKYKDKSLQGSNRLTKEMADLVNCFALEKSKNHKIEGRRVLKDGAIILPHLIIFNNENKHKLKDKFIELIKKHQEKNTIPKDPKDPFKIIAWNAEWKEEENSKGKLRLKDIFPDYSKEQKSKKEIFDTLSKYLQLYDTDKKTLEAIRKSILNGLIEILKKEEKKHQITFRQKKIEKFYSKSDMIESIKSYKKEEELNIAYEGFKQKLYDWCIDITRNKHEEVFDKIKSFVKNEFKEWFDLKINPSTQLFLLKFEKENIEKKKNNLEKEDVKIQIGTVHSAKGQTHCATMYIETAYNTPTYDSSKIKPKAKKGIYPNENPLFKETHKLDGVRAKEALKMMYVGFSRPTHLLCFAVLEENVKEDIEKYKSADWEIIDDLTKK